MKECFYPLGFCLNIDFVMDDLSHLQILQEPVQSHLVINFHLYIAWEKHNASSAKLLLRALYLAKGCTYSFKFHPLLCYVILFILFLLQKASRPFL